MATADWLAFRAVALLGIRSDWVHNFRTNANVRLKLGGTTYDAVGRVIVEPAERARR